MVNSVRGLTRGQMMRPRSDTAYARDYPRQLFNRSALAEFLKTAKLWYLKIGILHITLLVQEDFNLTVSF